MIGNHPIYGMENRVRTLPHAGCKEFPGVRGRAPVLLVLRLPLRDWRVRGL